MRPDDYRAIIAAYCFGLASAGMGVILWLWWVSVPHVCTCP